MAGQNPNRNAYGRAIEAVAGVLETLTDADFIETFDQELIQMSPDKAPVGKSANGSLINNAVEYTRTQAGTVAVKIELKKLTDPTVEPDFFTDLKLAGFKTGVWDDTGTDKVSAFYDGKPECNTGTFVTRSFACDGTSYAKVLRGGVIADGTIMSEGVGAPFVFTGTVSGAFPLPTTDSAVIVITHDAQNALQPTGSVNTIDAVPYNVQKIEYKLNTTATPNPDHSAADGTNIGFFRIGEGDPTETFTAIPLGDEATDFSNYANNVVATEQVIETDDFKMTISGIQYQDIQDGNEGGTHIQDKTVKVEGIRIDWK